MPLNLLPSISAQQSSASVLALTLATLLIVYFLIVLIESVVLQLLGWGTFKRSWLASMLVNLATTMLLVFLLTFIQRIGLPGLVVAWVLSVLVEGVILMLIKRGATRQNWVAAFFANTASYLILLMPAFLYSQRG